MIPCTMCAYHSPSDGNHCFRIQQEMNLNKCYYHYSKNSVNNMKQVCVSSMPRSHSRSSLCVTVPIGYFRKRKFSTTGNPNLSITQLIVQIRIAKSITVSVLHEKDTFLIWQLTL